MTGKITGISGPTVSVDLKGLTLYERVSVGHSMLTGEVVRIEENKAVLQVYEDTQGLAVGEPVMGSGAPLTVKLGRGSSLRYSTDSRGRSKNCLRNRGLFLNIQKRCPPSTRPGPGSSIP